MSQPDRSTSVPSTKKRGRATENPFQRPSQPASTSTNRLAGFKDKHPPAKKDPTKAMTEEERMAKRHEQILYLRHRLQKDFLSKDQPPQEKDMHMISQHLKDLEAHIDLERSVIEKSKIHKVLKCIIQLKSIPKEQEHRFKQRCRNLLFKWKFTQPDNNVAVVAAPRQVRLDNPRFGPAYSSSEERDILHKRHNKASRFNSDLQDGFLSDQGPQDGYMGLMSGTLMDLELYRDLETEIIDNTRIDSTLQGIVKLTRIPMEDMHYFRQRCNDLLTSWGRNPVLILEAAAEDTSPNQTSSSSENQDEPLNKRMPGDVLTMDDLNLTSLTNLTEHANVTHRNDNGFLGVFESIGWRGEKHQQQTGVHPFNIPGKEMGQMISAATFFERRKAARVAQDVQPEPASESEPEQAPPTLLYMSKPAKEFSMRRAKFELLRCDEARAARANEEAVAHRESLGEQASKTVNHRRRLLDLRAAEGILREAALEVIRLVDEEAVWKEKAAETWDTLQSIRDQMLALQKEHAEEKKAKAASQESSKRKAAETSSSQQPKDGEEAQDEDMMDVDDEKTQDEDRMVIEDEAVERPAKRQKRG